MSQVKCGGNSWITVGQPNENQDAITVTKQMRDLNQGESCTYRVKAVCGAPAFTTAPGGDWSSKLENFNITGIEFEKESTDDFQVRNILSQYLDGVDLNQDYIENDLVSSKFIYPMHDMDDILFMEKTTTISTEGLRNRPRKWIYSNSKVGWRAFNNPDQTPSGNNAMKEHEDDDNCKDRYMFVTLTSLEDNQSLDFKATSKSFAAYPALAEFMSGAQRNV